MKTLMLAAALGTVAIRETPSVPYSRVPIPATDERCRPTTIGNADSLIKHSIAAVGLDRMMAKVRTATHTDVISMKFQSDRMYPPYLRRTVNLTTSVDWEKGALRTEQTAGQATIANVTDGVRRVVYSPRGAQLLDVKQANLADDRALDPWMLLADWRSASGLRVSGECFYRDYWRTVVSRGSGPTEEKLYLDKKTGVPIKLDRRDRDFLWGDVHAEYLWSIWTPAGDATAPQFAFRIVEGELDYERITQNYKVISRDSAAGKFDIAADAAPIRPQTAPPPPDTVCVSANTFVLVTPAYTNVVTLQRDTVFVLDAQTSAVRAQQDSVWIGKLFPGKHPIVLVVTDLAWPHIAGVRYWVALGTPVISHRASKEFLQ